MTTTAHLLQTYLRTADLAGITVSSAAEGMGVSRHQLERHGNFTQALFEERVRRCVVNPEESTERLRLILGLSCRTAVRRHYRAAWGRGPRSGYLVTTCPRDDIETIMQIYRDAGCTVKELAHRSGYGLRQIYHWIKVYKQHGPGAFPPREWMT